jgi:hypothetical protein
MADSRKEESEVCLDTNRPSHGRTLACLVHYSYQPGDLVASLKKLVL